MSYQIGIDAIHLRPAGRLAHTEYCSNRALIEAVTGRGSDWLTREFCDAWEIDFNWITDDGPEHWSKRGRVTDMGHAEFLYMGSDKRSPTACPFKDEEDVLAFDAVKEYGLPDMRELVDYYERTHRKTRAENPNQVCPGGYYKTIVSGAIHAFGWDMLLTAAADPDRFEAVLDSIFRLSLHHYKAWAQTSIEVFICHDDMVWSQGAFMKPEFYRRVIFSRYRELWSVLKRAGKKVLFCSDGNWIEFIDDIVAAGADGFIFEPMMPLEPVVERYGRSHVIVSSKVDARTLTFGTQAQIQNEIIDTLRLARNCPGFIFAVGNHIPSNVPVANGIFYFDYLRRHWSRESRI